MVRAKPFAKEIRTITGVALLLLVAYLAAVIGITGTAFDPQPLLIGSILFIVSLPILAREAGRDGDRRLFWLLVAALALKLLAGVARHYMAFHIYGGKADAVGYHNTGVELAAAFRAGDFSTALPSLQGKEFINLVAGIVYTVIGSGSRISGFVFFSWMAFWGVFLGYRAFTIAVPEGRLRSYAHLVFFFPSLLFWPSSLGKEAWMVFALGVASFGAARLLTNRLLAGLAITGLGLLMGVWVRPHVVGMLAVSLVAGCLVMRPLRGLGRQARTAWFVGLCLATVVAVLILAQTKEFLGASDLLSPAGVVSELEAVSQRSDTGGSEFTPTVVRSPEDIPRAFFTVLFRPLPTEANNVQALIASLESVFLLVLSLVRLPWIWAAARSIRRQPYVMMAFVYTAIFCIAFASFPNFGLLARERVQLLPLYFVLLSVPPRWKRPVEAESGRGLSRLGAGLGGPDRV